jgi:hypothetical protein
MAYCNRLVWGAISVLWLVGISSPCLAAHPAEGHPIDGQWFDCWHYPAAEDSYNEITFMPESEYPDFDSLTQLEQYMLLGVSSSDLSGSPALPPWTTTILAWVAKYYAVYGSVPDTITPDIIRSLPGFEEFEDEAFQAEFNPLTGAYPRLNATQPSPGDLYIHALSEQELRHFVTLGYTYLQPSTNGHELDVYWPSLGTSERVSPVFYIRMYGYNGVLSNGFTIIAN